MGFFFSSLHQNVVHKQKSCCAHDTCCVTLKRVLQSHRCVVVLFCCVQCCFVLQCCYSVGVLVLCCLTLCCAVVWWLICEYVLCCIMFVALFVVLHCIVCVVLVLLSGGELCCFVLHCAVLCCFLYCIVWHCAEHVESVGFHHHSYSATAFKWQTVLILIRFYIGAAICQYEKFQSNSNMKGRKMVSEHMFRQLITQ